jgi:hypothetical protein
MHNREPLLVQRVQDMWAGDDEWQAGLVDKRPSPNRLNTTLGGWQAPLTLPRSGVRPRGFCTTALDSLGGAAKSPPTEEKTNTRDGARSSLECSQ